MNILFYRYGSICEPDIISGFLELGNYVHEITVEIYDKDFLPVDGVRLLEKELFAHSYDFVFSINFYPFISDVCNIFQLRYICWTVDSPVMELYSPSIRNEWNRIFLFDLAQYNEFAPKNPSCIFHLPLAGNPARCTATINQATSAEIARFSSEISFVGSLYTEKSPYKLPKNAPDYLRGYLDAVMNAQELIYGYNFLEEVLPENIVEEFQKLVPEFYIPPKGWDRNDRMTLAQRYLGYEISSMERIRVMKLLGDRYSLDVYTGSDTSNLPVNNCGFARTLTEMPLIFHYSKINLNITAKSIRSGLPLRLFDILACGGFLLTNYQSELTTYFTPGVELECYTSRDDLLAKTEYYLTHEKDRAEVAHNGLAASEKYHNYPERLLQMLSTAYGITKGDT